MGKSGLSEIRCTADKVDVPDTDKLKKVYYTTTKLEIPGDIRAKGGCVHQR